MHRFLLTAALSALLASPAGAQQLKLAFDHGHVSVDATSVPVRAILAEWAKLGGTKVVGGERIAGAPLTLKLVDVPEAQALEIILRNVAGYMAAPRVASIGASIYDRILVLATSAAPTTAAAAARTTPINQGSAAGTQRFIPPRVAPQAPNEDDQPDDEPQPGQQPPFTFPAPGQGAVSFPGGGPGMINVDPNTGAPQTITVNPSTNQPTFGTGGAAQPGVIQQPPPPVRPGQPPQPGPFPRPPG